MLITKILRELDAELERLQTARNTIAALIAPAFREQRPSRPLRVGAGAAEKALRGLDAAPKDEAAPGSEPAPQVGAAPRVGAGTIPAPVRRRGRPRGSVNRPSGLPRRSARIHAAGAAEPTALTRAVAAGPVFVSAAELELRRKQPAVLRAPEGMQPTVGNGTLEALIREVSERRAATAA